MNEEQKQAVADLKIKYENLMLDSTGEGAEEDDVLYRRMIEATPQAPESVQNGTADMKTLFNALGAIFWVACILTLTPVIILAWVLVSLGYGKELEGY